MDINTKCLKCHASCSVLCTNCRCINSTMYDYIDDIRGCRDCRYSVENC